MLDWMVDNVIAGRNGSEGVTWAEGDQLPGEVRSLLLLAAELGQVRKRLRWVWVLLRVICCTGCVGSWYTWVQWSLVYRSAVIPVVQNIRFYKNY